MEIAQSAAQPLLAGGCVIEPREGRRSPARASSHHAQLNDRLIGRGSFLTFARSFSGQWNIGRQSGRRIYIQANVARAAVLIEIKEPRQSGPVASRSRRADSTRRVGFPTNRTCRCVSVPVLGWGQSSQDFKNDPAFLRLHFRCRPRRHNFIGRCGDRNLGKAAQRQGIEEARKRTAKPYRSGRSPHWLKVKNPKAPAVKREAEEDWGR